MDNAGMVKYQTQKAVSALYIVHHNARRLNATSEFIPEWDKTVLPMSDNELKGLVYKALKAISEMLLYWDEKKEVGLSQGSLTDKGVE